MEENKIRSKSNENCPFRKSPFIDDQHAEYYDFQITDSRTWFKKLLNSIRFGWNSTLPDTLFEPNCTIPVVVLGQVYENDENNRSNSKEAFKEKLKTIPWVTYRSHFRPIMTNSGKKFTSDSGWGCTIRVGQMMLLATLRKHFTYYYSPEEAEKHTHILKLIEENLISAPYSLHNILSLGDVGKSPGQWFSPSDIFSSLIKLLRITPVSNFIPILCLDYTINKVEIYSEACEVTKAYLSTVRNSKNSPKSSRLIWKNSVFLMIPLMLGYRNIEEKFLNALKFFLSIPYSTGIIVDKSGSALYLIGFFGDMGIALDPHVVKKANKNLLEFKSRVLESVCEHVVLVNLKELGPSVGVGFFVQGEQEFAEFIQAIVDNEQFVKGLLVIGDDRNQGVGEEDGDYFVC